MFGRARQLLATRVQAEASCAVGHDLQQTAGHRDVLEEVNELVLIGQSTVEDHRSEDTEKRQPAATTRVLYPAIRATPPAISTRMASVSAKEGNGRPTELM